MNIASDINACARSTKHPTAKTYTKVVTIALENSNIKFDRLHKALREAIKSGSWIVIENAHHVAEWPREILNLFYRIKDSFKFQEEQDLWQDYRLDIQQKRQQAKEEVSTESMEVVEIPPQSIEKKEAVNEPVKNELNEPLVIHKKFRLWVVTESDQIINLPSSLVYDAIKISPQISELKQTYASCQKLALAYDKSGQQTRFEEAAILHTVLSHNDYICKHAWDLRDFMDYMRFLANDLGQFETDEIYEKIMYEVIYGSKMKNVVDLNYIKKLINQIIVQKRYDIQQFIENSHKFYSKVDRAEESK